MKLVKSLVYRSRHVAEQARTLSLHVRVGLPSVRLSHLATKGVEQVKAPIKDEICLPPYYGTTTHDDYTAAMALAAACEPKVVFEIGTAYGNLTANVCNHFPDAQVYTVNAPVQIQTGDIISFELTAEEIGRVYRKYGFESRVRQILSNSLDLDLSQFFSSPIIDFAIVDGCHDVEYVVNDFKKVAPFVRPGGIVLLHDTFPDPFPRNSVEDGKVVPRTHLASSYVACMMLRREGYDIRHVADTWWAAWQRPLEAQAA